MDQSKKNTKLSETLAFLNKFHSIHGVTLLFKDQKPLWRRILDIWLLFSIATYEILIILGSSSRFSTNNRVGRVACRISAVSLIFIPLLESFYLVRRKDILKLVDWCHLVETYQPLVLYKPKDWFLPQRNNVLKFIRYQNSCQI